MKNLLCSVLISFLIVIPAYGRNDAAELPDSVFSGYQGKHHVQGIAVDVERGRVFFSFTTRLIVTDFRGKLIGSVNGLTGHLGCLAYNAGNNRLYGSIEYKNDVIGRGIAGEAAKDWQSKFYIAPQSISIAGLASPHPPLSVSTDNPEIP